MNPTKKCSKCHKIKSFEEFYRDKNRKDGRYPQCKKCRKESDNKYRQRHRKELRESSKIYYEKTGREKRGYISMHKNKLCSSYLGVVIAERLCRYIFKDVQVMPYGNTGFDIICIKSKKIDVKSGCLIKNKYPFWQFKIGKNITADYFICVAFDNRTDLNPIHLWMVPGHEVNHKPTIQISPPTIHKWDKWKRDIKDAQLCCNEIKAKA